MKYKFLTLSLLLAGACVTMSAQTEKENYYTKKWTNNIFISVGGGVHTVFGDDCDRVSPAVSISLGKYITPTWGVRAQVNGLWQSMCNHEGVADYHKQNKKYVGINIDAMLNLSTLFAGVNPDRIFELYAFVGPQMSIAKSQNVTETVNGSTGAVTAKYVSGDDKTRARIGGSVGVDLKFNVSKYVAIDIEARGAIAPSVFGNISKHRKSEGTGILTAGITYTFGGKKFAKVSDRIIEREVVKEVTKEVPKEVVKEVVKEVPTASAAAIFFKINKADISPEGMVNIKLIAKTMKASPNTKYQVAGYADSDTGTPEINQTLSEKRAQAVYDALVAEGVSESQLQKVAMGGTEPMFEKAYLNRVVILEVK